MPPRHMAAPLTEEEKQSKPKITPAFISRIASYLKPYKWIFLLVFALTVIIAVAQVYPSMITGQMIDDGLYKGDFEKLIVLALYSFVILAASAGLSVLRGYLSTWIAQHITCDMRNQMFSHLQKMSQGFFTTHKQGDIITRMTSDIMGIQSVITEVFTGTVTHIVTLIVTLIALFSKNWIIAVVGLVLAPLSVIPSHMVGKRRWKFARLLQSKYDASNQIINEDFNVNGQQLVKLFTKEDEEYNRFSAINLDMTNTTIKEMVVGRWFGASIRLMTAIAPVIIYLIGGFLMIKLEIGITVGDVAVAVALLARLYNPVEQLMNVHVNFTRSMALYQRVFEYLDTEEDIKDPENPVVPENLRGEVKFENVSFSYNAQRETLHNVSFEVTQGKMVALVGPSGAGKTTVSYLIPRLYDVSDGKIMVDGVDVRDMSISFLRHNIGIVTQETYLFNASVKDNLKFAKSDATDEELYAACIKANIHDYILSLPNGYDTVVGARGFKLSGGEKQRISIARMLLKDPKILIMDEATSSLDSISEKHIQDAIAPLLKGRTSIVIAHRLSTVMQADNILVLDHGQIVEQGTHENLLAQGGTYKSLYETQFMK